MLLTRIRYCKTLWISWSHIWGWHPPPHPLAYCVPPYFGLAYCVAPFFGLTYYVPFNNKNNHYWRFHLHKEDKITICCMHVQSFLKTLALMCLLAKFPRFWPPKKVRGKRAGKKIRAIFYLTLYVTCVMFLHSGLSPLSLNPSISINQSLQDCRHP